MRQNSAMKRNLPVLLLTIFASAALLVFGYSIFGDFHGATDNAEVYYNARVIEILGNPEEGRVYDENTGELKSSTVNFKAKLTSGDSKGAVVEATQYNDYSLAYVSDDVEVGDRIIVTSVYDFATCDYNWQFGGINRTGPLLILCALFFALIVVIGRKKGFLTILSLAFTAGAVFLVFIPAILKGINIYFITIIVSLYIVLMTLILLNGYNLKTLSAIVGNIGGLLVSGLISLLMNAVLKITGVVNEDSVSLMLLGNGVKIDLVAIVWGSIVIGALGAVMDVAMSIASSMQELSDTMKDKNFKAMVRSGMNIGKDAIGTMTNTLILAYIGGSLSTVLILVAYNVDLLYLFDLELIAIEVVKSIVGSIGIICAVPITTLFAAFFFNGGKKENDAVE